MKEPLWLEEREVLIFHDRLLALHGGATGIRDVGLIASALARPKQFATYGDAPDLMHLAARYTAGIVRNHPFVDGNKRTGFLLGVLFLELNGYTFSASEAEAARAVIALTSGDMDEDGYARFLAVNTAPEEGEHG